MIDLNSLKDWTNLSDTVILYVTGYMVKNMAMFGKIFFLFLLVLALAACGGNETQESSEPVTIDTPAPTTIPAPDPGVLLVEPNAGLGPISPYLLGSNYGPWVAVPADMLPEAFDSGVAAIRFPGGAWGDRNDLQPYQIDYFMDFVGQVGAIPVVSVRLREGTPEQAADLVRYFNIEKRYGVEHWIIGNEPTLYAAELQAVGRANDYDTEQHNADWRAFALAMKEADPDIKLLGPETHQFNHDPGFNPKDSSRRDDGALTLMIVNLADVEKTAVLQLSGETPAQLELWRLDQEQIPETSSEIPYPVDGLLSLPPQSLSLFILNSAN